MKNYRVLFVIALFEAIVIGLLVMKLKNVQTQLKEGEALMANVIKSHLLSESAVMNALNIKLKNGDYGMVRQIFQSTISTNVLFLQNKTYGELSLEEQQSLDVILKGMNDWQQSKAAKNEK